MKLLEIEYLGFLSPLFVDLNQFMIYYTVFIQKEKIYPINL